MAYFLKKSRNKKGLYLQIYENFWDPRRGHTAHRSVRAVGYEHELRESGIDDPVSHFRAEVDAMNAERRAARDRERVREIGPEPAERHLGHFAIRAIDDALGVAEDLAWLQVPSGFQESLGIWALPAFLVECGERAMLIHGVADFETLMRAAGSVAPIGRE